MIDGRKARGASLIRYFLGGMLLLLVPFIVQDGRAPWSLGVAIAIGAVVIMFGDRRVFRPAIARESDAIVCRYVPWNETGPYIALGAVPLLGLCGIDLGFRSGFSAVFGWAGLFLLAVIPLSLLAFIRASRRCMLQVRPTALSVPLPGNGYTMTDISRQRVRSVTHRTAKVGLGTDLLVTEISCGATESERGADQVVRLGPAPVKDTVWLTIDPGNLLEGLEVWKGGDPDDPRLMDRIESIFRGQSPRNA